MKELRNGIKIIGIDHGYGNIKTANTVTPTGIFSLAVLSLLLPVYLYFLRTTDLIPIVHINRQTR